jgi:hypothetical protein
MDATSLTFPTSLTSPPNLAVADETAFNGHRVGQHRGWATKARSHQEGQAIHSVFRRNGFTSTVVGHEDTKPRRKQSRSSSCLRVFVAIDLADYPAAAASSYEFLLRALLVCFRAFVAIDAAVYPAAAESRARRRGSLRF